jgi:hypothetical protein
MLAHIIAHFLTLQQAAAANAASSPATLIARGRRCMLLAQAQDLRRDRQEGLGEL